MAEKKFTQIAVTPPTQKKLSILAAVIGPSIYELVDTWADDAWEKAKKQGLVTDAMLAPTPTDKKKQVTSAPLAVTA